MLPKLLIANRGEIACRIMRTCKRLGVKTVAVFSDADRNAMHVALADEAVYLGGSPARESYLNSDKLIAAALQSGSKAIHPGYGFLSENSAFAQAVADAGIEFVGPPASAIAAMGSKSGSKRLMTDAGVACTPGYHGADQTLERLRREAARVGFPLMLKADAGGGGKGMRIVESMAALDENIESCRREALSSFKDDKILMERYVRKARHVEFQIFADKHGNCLHLYERDCSVQRRHQKVLEESPAPFLDPAMREQMGRAAVQAAKAVGYVGAGTVEFMIDAEDPRRSFYFMEMNTRLQVEHPVTEMVTGLDLVEWQLRVASGERLPILDQKLVPMSGHAIEARIYAENPAGGFLPGSGPLTYVREPSLDGDTRVETGVRQGDTVSIFYDPMISKLVVRGPDRAAALERMARKLAEYRVAGLSTNLDFVLSCVRHPAFAHGGVPTSFINENLAALVPQNEASSSEGFSGLGFAADESRFVAVVSSAAVALAASSASNEDAQRLFRLGGRAPLIRFDMMGPGKKRVCVASRVRAEQGWVSVEAKAGDDKAVGRARLVGNDTIDVEVSGKLVAGLGLVLIPHPKHTTLHLFSGGKLPRLLFQVDILPPDFKKRGGAAAGKGVSVMYSPMPGKVTRVLVKPGDKVEALQTLVVLEAMKMEHVVRATRAGVVKEVMVNAGALVVDGVELCSLAE